MCQIVAWSDNLFPFQSILTNKNWNSILLIISEISDYDLHCMTDFFRNTTCDNGPLTRYVKLRVAHVPGMFSPPPRVSDTDMLHDTCVTHVPWCLLGSLTSCFLWSLWWGKRSLHSWSMGNQQFYASDKRPFGIIVKHKIPLTKNRESREINRIHYVNQDGKHNIVNRHYQSQP